VRDFTLRAYREYLGSLKKAYPLFLSFYEYFSLKLKPDRFCIIRHDVDRMPRRAMRMAELENRLGVHATYFFRIKRNTFRPDIIRSISELGHEIGYHYESLSDAKGNFDLALADFAQNLEKIRRIAPVQTVVMHGRPLSKYDNLDLWRMPDARSRRKDSFGLLGEVYLDIDYSDIAYITDTGRNWLSNQSNRRDTVRSEIKLDFKSGNLLRQYFDNNPHPKLIFTVHPERWTNAQIAYCVRFLFDACVNIAKSLNKRR